MLSPFCLPPLSLSGNDFNYFQQVVPLEDLQNGFQISLNSATFTFPQDFNLQIAEHYLAQTGLLLFCFQNYDSNVHCFINLIVSLTITPIGYENVNISCVTFNLASSVLTDGSQPSAVCISFLLLLLIFKNFIRY